MSDLNLRRRKPAARASTTELPQNSTFELEGGKLTKDALIKGWETGNAKKLIADLGKERYFYENIMFLEDTDHYNDGDGIGKDEFQQLFDKYIIDDAVYQLNLPSHVFNAMKKRQMPRKNQPRSLSRKFGLQFLSCFTQLLVLSFVTGSSKEE
eukprot:4262641-Amphidinium_carterae.2